MDRDQRFPRLRRAGPGLLTGAAILSLVLLVSPFNIGSLLLAYVVVLGFGLIIKLLEMLLNHMKPLVERLDRLDPHHRWASTPAAYIYSKCGYSLRGVEGIYCPECGTVRPARPVHEHDPPDDGLGVPDRVPGSSVGP